MTTTERGRWGETLAVIHLEKNNTQVLLRNWRWNRFEIDLICRNGKMGICRSQGEKVGFGDVGVEAVNSRKQERITRPPIISCAFTTSTRRDPFRHHLHRVQPPHAPHQPHSRRVHLPAHLRYLCAMKKPASSGRSGSRSNNRSNASALDEVIFVPAPSRSKDRPGGAATSPAPVSRWAPPAGRCA